MKYLLTENRINSVVKKYLDKEFDISELHYNQPEFDDYDTGEIGSIEDTGEWYFGDYDDDNTFARAYGYNYFGEEFHIKNNKTKNDFPALVLEKSYENELNNMFGDSSVWGPAFIEWFNEKTGSNIKGYLL
jgi:hypothetical protein